ncbi:DUF3089 domain-containing protein [Steroidobacter sp. S1-65]|uniref:DUF3089 domain-containing protein n=1 Tax=Steroidobacter gossypii TaxID=2805490 RepID=A0ABS1X2N4_9GAMM|nr:DUF3089 domain-containing protein [Steroidobacter gossypii]MBM0107474.1 DUF3089 domain-containing protein [Steroidobacter gossypii]
MSNVIIRASLAVCGVLLGASALAQSSSPQSAPQAANDYSKPETWLCRPGRKDSCAVDLTTTVIAADGNLTKEPFKANPDASVDCFYVYPTVSNDQTPNSDMNAGPEEHAVVRAQFARFGSKCKLYAPLYRQVTLKTLRAAMAGGAGFPADRMLGYHDVLSAWNYYLQHDNKGRGVVLIGHSQGSAVLTQLIKNEIDGKPIQSRIISALLLGTNVAVPKGKDVGGAFQHMTLCRSPSQLGCVISYAAFRADVPPPSNSRFGRVPEDGMVAACVNPAALDGGKGQMHAYLSTGSNGVSTSSAAPKPWVSTGQTIDTPFVSVPGLLTGECISNEAGSYLAITTHANPSDPRTDEIPGDVVANGVVLKDWGLHLIDAHVAMGNLIDVVAEQSKAYLNK